MRLHAPSRRELLLASGTLFAWAHLPRLAHAEGRDPRFLAVILRGALDELATVAPVGDPKRGDNALTLDSKVPALKLNDFFGLRRCRTCIACSRRARRSSYTPRRRPIANARISTARIF